MHTARWDHDEDLRGSAPWASSTRAQRPTSTASCPSPRRGSAPGCGTCEQCAMAASGEAGHAKASLIGTEEPLTVEVDQVRRVVGAPDISLPSHRAQVLAHILT